GSFYYMRRVFDEVAAQYTEVDANHIYVDAAALQLVRQPWIFDVLVTDNMFGDILSDLGAGLMGGMGMAPSADIGQTNAVFQPCHGSAPDIAGDGKANPTAIFLSAAMMPEWLGHQHANASLIEAASAVNRAVENAFAAGDLLPWELGGTDGTDTITRKVFDQMTQR
ncbi:MAG: isocitrate/isopropylmalate dehydrogenase family protein, partial [Gammaproteobacteria bacterium]|nr:isocitrate/isopropylmalate dehydrogenase family protein [Gammaproteobacteria bacterium]